MTKTPRKRRKSKQVSCRKKKKKNYTSKELKEREVVQPTAAANATSEGPENQSIPQCPENQPPIPNAPPAAAAGKRTKGKNINYDERDKGLGKKLFSEASKRTMIGGYFVFQHGMETYETLWGGK